MTTDKQYYTPLLSPSKIGNMIVKNRLVAQAMEASDASENGGISDRALERYLRLAEGDWGIVFIEATSVTDASLARIDGLILNETTFPSFKNLVDRYKSINPNSLILIQLTHSGCLSHPVTDRITPISQDKALQSLTSKEIESIRNQFIQAAKLSYLAGFDGIDFKLCHGYLGTELLRPSNNRVDQWGGTFENRIRFWKLGIQDIRTALTSLGQRDFLLGSRISFHENILGGFGTGGPHTNEFDSAEPLSLIMQMQDLNLDYVNISGTEVNLSDYIINTPEEKLVNTLFYERTVKEYLNTICNKKRSEKKLLVIGTGYSQLGESSLQIANDRLNAGYTDFIGFGRQSFADPYMPQKLYHNEKINFCVGCNSCAKLMLNGHPSSCVVFDK